MSTTESRPGITAAVLQDLANTELSLKSRLGYVALLLVSLTMCGIIGSLWATEPMLPLRTHLAFAVMLLIGLSWSAFALRVLTTRRILLARHSVVAGRLAVAFTSIHVVGALLIGYVTQAAAAFVAAGVGVAMLAIAIALLVRAHRNFAKLSARREQLDRQLGVRR